MEVYNTYNHRLNLIKRGIRLSLSYIIYNNSFKKTGSYFVGKCRHTYCSQLRLFSVPWLCKQKLKRKRFLVIKRPPFQEKGSHRSCSEVMKFFFRGMECLSDKTQHHILECSPDTKNKCSLLHDYRCHLETAMSMREPCLRSIHCSFGGNPDTESFLLFL